MRAQNVFCVKAKWGKEDVRCCVDVVVGKGSRGVEAEMGDAKKGNFHAIRLCVGFWRGFHIH